MKVLCVLNPSAAGGDALRLWPSVAERLRLQGVDFDLLSGEPGKQLKDQAFARLLEAPRGAYDVIAGIGGDGTHAGVINGMMKARAAGIPIPKYAFIPLGTGNDIAKSLGIRLRDEFSDKDLCRAVSAIMHGADYRLDLGVINGTYFADALTVGLDSRILNERNNSKRALERIPLLRFMAKGRFLYTLSFGARFFQQLPVDGEIWVDGRLWYQGQLINVVINNTRIYAGDFDFSSEAYPDDGLLDVVMFTEHADYLTRYLLALRHNPAKVRELSDELHRLSRRVQGRDIRIRMARPEPAQIDGEEVAAASEFNVTVERQVLAIKTPAEPP